ncbi:MAG: hypothetical protein PHV37_05825 [Candidatus Gastranaerophilales bacterium]|nr:hypothetical protein [Candidatus Gastranaerophilales bacterium]
MKITNSTINYAQNANLDKFKKPSSKNQSFGHKLPNYDDVLKTVGKPLGKGLAGLAEKSGFQKAVGKFSKCSNSYKHLLTLESFIITGFYMFNTSRNKKMEKNQKFPLMLNDFLVTAFATAVGYAVDGKINKTVSDVTDCFKESVKNKTIMETGILSAVPKDKLKAAAGSIKKDGLKKGIDGLIENISSVVDESTAKAVRKGLTDNAVSGASDAVTKSLKNIDKAARGLSAAKSLVIFGFIYRYLGPVLMTPIANKLSSKIQHRKKANAEGAQPAAAQPTTTQVTAQNAKQQEEKPQTVAQQAPQQAQPAQNTKPEVHKEHDDDHDHDDHKKDKKDD